MLDGSQSEPKDRTTARWEAGGWRLEEEGLRGWLLACGCLLGFRPGKEQRQRPGRKDQGGVPQTRAAGSLFGGVVDDSQPLIRRCE